jgi:hypothetical protein
MAFLTFGMRVGFLQTVARSQPTAIFLHSILYERPGV